MQRVGVLDKPGIYFLKLKIVFSYRDGASLSRARGGFRALRTLRRWPPHRNAIGEDSRRNSLESR